MNSKLIPWVAGMAGSYLGWFIGARFSIFMAFILSIVGTGVGIYYGRKWMLEHL
jgi:hypothetical protein